MRGFYSRIDGSAQPYLLTMPDGYDRGGDAAATGSTSSCTAATTPCSSSSSWRSRPPATPPSRSAPAPIASCCSRTAATRMRAGSPVRPTASKRSSRSPKAYPIDRDRIVMAGFSMGGAVGVVLHRALRRSLGGRRAGRRVSPRPRCSCAARWHGSRRTPCSGRSGTCTTPTDYAMNTFNVPVVAYSGGIDAQKQAADAMAAAMLRGRPHARARHRSEDRPRLRAAAHGSRCRIGSTQLAAHGRNPVPKEIRFTTWMLRYNRMFWMTVDAMEAEWQRARVNARDRRRTPSS